MTVSLLARLALDLLAVSALVYGLFLPRHRRVDLVVVYALFNIGLFLALVVISAGEVSMGVGFGLFAVLSIVRLRSEPFSNRELAYFFVALVLALVCAIDHDCQTLTRVPEDYALDGNILDGLLVRIPDDGDGWPDLREYWPADPVD